VIAQVEGEFRVRGFKVVLSKPTINRYIRDDMIGTKPLSQGSTDDGFIALEMNLWTSQVTELERGKKSLTIYHVRRDAPITILDRIEY
jgi:hypothetical protein